MKLADHPDPRMWWVAHLVGVPFLLGCLALGAWSLSGCAAMAQDPVAAGVPLQAPATSDPLSDLFMRALQALGMPAVLTGIAGYLLRGGGPTLTIRTAEPVSVTLSKEDRDLVHQAVRASAQLDERTRASRREQVRMRAYVHWHGRCLQALAGHEGVDLPAPPLFAEDEDSDEPPPPRAA